MLKCSSMILSKRDTFKNQLYFGLLKKYFSIGACIVWKQVYYLLFFMFYLFTYLYCFLFSFFFFLDSIWSEFLLRAVSIYILVFVNLFIYLLTYLEAPWRSSFLAQLHVDGMQLYQQ